MMIRITGVVLFLIAIVYIVVALSQMTWPAMPSLPK
jgi:hypothetical protein